VRPTEVLRALAYPLVTPGVLIPLLVFWLLLSFAVWGGLLGLFLLFLVVPAVVRFLVIVLEARARGAEPATPDIEFFNWFGNAWTLFPAPVALGLAWATHWSAQALGTPWPLLLASGVFLPASFAVLAVTRSPLQSLNPLALWRLWRACLPTLWIGAAFLLPAGWLALLAGGLPLMPGLLLQLVLAFAFMSLLGRVLEPHRLMDELDIPDPVDKGADEQAADVEKAREAVLTHAYGFISRGNRDGGFRHLIRAIDDEPDPATAWAWYFDRMTRWERPEPALFFARHYIRELLRHGEEVPALKVILRGLHMDEGFKPFPEDIERAIAAAERHGNTEFAAVLRRM
jgi:hypothetical protein